MVYGQNMALCSKCCNGYIVGDTIPLGEECPDCKALNVKVVDLSHLVAPTMKDKLKQEIQAIMNDALAGVVNIYRYEQDGQSYIRWEE